MTLLDRFRTQSPHKSGDPLVRLAFVQELPLDDRDLLAEIVRDDPDPRVRRAAAGKLMDPSVLGTVATSDADADVRQRALAMLRDIALDAFEGLAPADSLAAVDALADAKTLGTIAKTALREDVALRALVRVTEPRALGSVARHAPLEPVRLAALAATTDHADVFGVALNSEFKDSAVAAVERLDDRGELEQIAARARHKSAAKRARGRLREMDEQAAAEAAAPPPVEPIADTPSEERLEELAAERKAEEDARRQEAARIEMDEARALADAEAQRVRDEEQAVERRRLEEEASARERELQEQRAAEARVRDAARIEAEARDAQARQAALIRLTELSARLEALAARPDVTLKAGERALRDLRAALSDLPALPTPGDREQILQRLTLVQDALTPKVQELRDAADWRQWANLGVQEQLCVKMEGLAAVTDASEVARQVRELQEQWRQVSDVPRPQGEALWRRFKAAHDVAWARTEAHFAAEAAERAANLARKAALCERAEALSASTSWIETAEAIKTLQAEWKTIGAVPRGQEKAIWERFRGACDRFFTRRQADLAERKQLWAANMAKKEALCVQAEALVDSTDWDRAAAEIKRLQQEWKTVGAVKKNRSEAIWQRFRGACDRFFARYAQRHEIARGERVAAREAICAELESLAPQAPPAESTDAAAPAPQEDVVARVRALRERWNQEIAARGVDRERAATLDERFAAAFARVVSAWPAAFAGGDLDPAANRKRMDALVRRMEDLAHSLGAPGAAADSALSPTTKLASMLKEALAANTIGGKVDDEVKLRAAVEDVRQAQASWSRIGPVPPDVRRSLTDRFARACQRVTERAAGAAKAPARR